jgi:hypothetical protein
VRPKPIGSGFELSKQSAPLDCHHVGERVLLGAEWLGRALEKGDFLLEQFDGHLEAS